MRVLHLTSSFPRWEGDHQAPFMADLMAAQRAAGLEPHVLAPHGPGLRRSDRVAGTPVDRFRYGPDAGEVLAYRGGVLPAARRPLGAAALGPFLVAFAAAATGLARRERMDVLHAHWWLPAGWAGVVASTAAGVPLVVTCHGSDVELARRHRLARRGARAVLSRAEVAAAVSGPLAAAVAEVTGVETRVLRMPLKAPAGGLAPLPPVPPIRLLAVGRLSREKGFDVAIAAVALLAAQGVDVYLRIVGEGPEGPGLDRAARAIPGDRVHLIGPVSPAELAKAMRDCHAVVVPSRHEGLGLVALEALARGRPVIASEVGGLVEVVAGPEDGILVAPDDPSALAAAIRQLPLPLPPPGGEALGRHDPALVASEHLDAYEVARARRPPRRPPRSRVPPA